MATWPRAAARWRAAAPSALGASGGMPDSRSITSDASSPPNAAVCSAHQPTLLRIVSSSTSAAAAAPWSEFGFLRGPRCHSRVEQTCVAGRPSRYDFALDALQLDRRRPVPYERLERELDAASLWDSLNFITIPAVRRHCRARGVSVTFDRGIMERMLARLDNDPEFARRQGAMANVARLLVRMRIARLLQVMPADIAPYMKAVIHI